MKVLHLHKLRGVSGSENHLLALLPALRAAGVDARFLGLDVPGTSDEFYARLDELGVPSSRVRCGADVSPRMARDVIRAVRAERPDLLHTHLVHADVYGAIAARAARVPYVSTRHNDDRYLLGPFRYVDRAFARGARRLIAISEAVRAFLVAAGHDPRKLVTVPYGLDELPVGSLGGHARGGRDSSGRAAPPRRRPPDRAEGPRDAAACVRGAPRAAPGGSARDPRRAARWRPRPARSWRRSSSPTGSCCRAGSRSGTGSSAPTSSSTPRAGRASGSSCSRRCWPGCPSSRRV